MHVIARCIDDIAWPRLVWGHARGASVRAGELIERKPAEHSWPDALPSRVYIPDWRLVTGPKTAPAIAMHQGADVDRMGSPRVRKTPT